MTGVKKLAIGLLTAVVLCLIGGLVFVRWIGAWGILFPSDHHDTRPPEIAVDFGRDAELRLLVYSKTNSFRHTCLLYTSDAADDFAVV